MAENKTTGIIAMFILALLGLVFISAMTGILNPQTDLSTATSEEINISSAIIDDNNINTSVSFDLDYGYSTTGNTPISSLVITNGTTTATLTTDYLVDTDLGNFSLKNSTYMLGAGDTLYATYNYKASGYLDNSFARLVTSLIIGFTALVIVVYLVGKAMGIFTAEA